MNRQITREELSSVHQFHAVTAWLGATAIAVVACAVTIVLHAI